MGYDTYYKLRTKNASKEQEEKLLKMFQDACDEYNKDWDWTVAEFNGVDIGEASKWYDCDNDMRELSAREEYKDVLFILDGEGMENEDIWTSYFKNGEMKTLYAEINIPEFDEEAFDIKKDNKYFLIKTYNASRGKGANVKIERTEDICKMAKRTLQLGKVGTYSQGLYLVDIKTFEEAFTLDIIHNMQEHGTLDYYPNGQEHSGHIFKSSTDKYPIFKKEVYLKYGVAREADYRKEQ